MSQNSKMKVKEEKYGKTELTVSHNGNDLTFIYPSFDSFYPERSIDEAELGRPTLAQTVSLVHTAFNSDDVYSEEIKKRIKDGVLAFTGVLYVPNKGVYFEDDPKVSFGMPKMKESELIKKLEKNDPSVRFVPFGFKVCWITSEELRKNKYVIGLVGEESADKLADIAGRFKKDPTLCNYSFTDGLLKRISFMGVQRVIEPYILEESLNIGDSPGFNCRNASVFGYKLENPPKNSLRRWRYELYD